MGIMAVAASGHWVTIDSFATNSNHRTNNFVTTEEKPRYWIGFDLGGTKMQCTLFDEKLKVIDSQRKRTRSEQATGENVERIRTTIAKLLDEHKVPLGQLAGIGIGCPGPVEWEKGDWRQGIVRVAVNLGWNNVPIAKLLKDQFKCPVAVLNDVDAGVYGEFHSGAAQGSRSAVGIFPGTGIGGGCVYDGQILRGKLLSCMELGHIKICSSPRVGATGMTGTLETEASRLAIAGELAKLAYRGEAPHLLKDAGTKLSAIRSKTIAEAISNGDTHVLKVVQEACEILGQAVANVVLLICPDCIVLGGGLVEAMPELFVKEISKVAKRNVFECYRDQFEVRAAKLGDDAATVGAAAWIRKQLADSK